VRWAEQQGHEVVAVVADHKSGRSGLTARPKLRPWVTEPDKLVRYDADRGAEGEPADAWQPSADWYDDDQDLDDEEEPTPAVAQ
jgi:hypothetical protein